MKKTVYLCAAALTMATMSCGGGQNNTQNGEQTAQQTETQRHGSIHRRRKRGSL